MVINLFVKTLYKAMKQNIQFVNTEWNKGIERLTTQKLNALAKKYSWATGAKVFYKNEKKDQEQGNICEIEISYPGPLIYASNKAKSFEIALNETIKRLSVQLKKRNAVMRNRQRESFKTV